MIPPIDIYEDGVYYYVFYPSSDLNCLTMSPWGNLYGWIKKRNPRIWKDKSKNNWGLGSKILFENCPPRVKEEIRKEWSAQ